MGENGIISVDSDGCLRTPVRGTIQVFSQEFGVTSDGCQVHFRVAPQVQVDLVEALRTVAKDLLIEDDPKLQTLVRENSATSPVCILDVQGDARWSSIYERHVEVSRQAPFDLLLVGDSLVQQMELSDTWENLARFRPLNFGIGGDEIQHALWRFKNAGFTSSAAPKACVVLVGTNNHKNTASEVVKGICGLARAIKDTWPSTTVVLVVKEKKVLFCAAEDS